MNRLHGCIVNETEKIFLKKKTIVFLIISALIPLIVSLGISKLQIASGIGAINSSGFMVMMLNLFTNFLIPLFVFMAAADAFTGERSDRTLKLTLLRPVSRFKIFLAKNISIGIYIILTLLVVLASSVISGLFLKGSGLMILEGLKLCIAAFFPAMCLGIFSIFVTQFFKNTSGAFATLIFLILGLKVIGIFIPQISRVLFTSYLDWHMLWLGNVGAGKLINVFMFILSYSIIFFAAGFFFFDKKDA